ncbi:unnamed protein product [Knipowitschia caucasica]|uniref:Uncharacterized protein n=1 Tax=Knipowitschia caucasica TaxID=637954 RepID=A0AAV2LIR7_KNICA
MGFEMKVIALPVCESSLNICKYETKVTDLSLEKNHCTEELQTRRISSQEIVLDLCKDYTEPYVIQTSHKEAETEHPSNKTDTGENLTVTVCNETEAALSLPHLDKEHSSRSETEVHLTMTLSDVSNATHEQNPVHLDGSPEPNDAATLSNTKEKEIVNELQLEDVDATFTNIHKLPEEHVDVDHKPGEHCNTNTKEATKDTPSEQEDLHQQDMKENMSLENHAQMLEIPLLIHTSVSIPAPETNSTSFDASHSEEIKPQETVSMGPPQWRDVSDSQLNTIDMTVQAEADGSEVSPGGYEDVTYLVGGLIKELSFLNRTVMATHRELENLHRRGKNTRNSIR